MRIKRELSLSRAKIGSLAAAVAFGPQASSAAAAADFPDLSRSTRLASPEGAVTFKVAVSDKGKADRPRDPLTGAAP